MSVKHTLAGRNRETTRTKQRPPGTRLTEEQKLLIATAIEAGATDYVAAEVAGISARSFRELRQRAEGRHPSRRSTPELKQFFARVDEAIARARMKAEIEIADRDAKHWLRYRAPSKPGLDGWTAPVPEEPESVELGHVMSPDELREVVTTLVVSGAVPLPRCGDPSCTCRHHAPVSEGAGS
jgi:head-tail adaptor